MEKNDIKDFDIYKSIDDYIHNILDYEIVCYKRKYRRDITWYVSLEIATMISSVSIPLLTKMASGSQSTNSSIIDIIAIMGSLATILNGLLSFFNLKSHYLLYKHIYKRLELEKYTFEYKLVPKDSFNDKIKKFLLTQSLTKLQDNIREIIVTGERIINGLDKSSNKDTKEESDKTSNSDTKSNQN